MPAGLSSYIYTAMAGKTLSLCCISLSGDAINWTFSTGPDATHSLESFHCSTEQQAFSTKGIDFHPYCDSATITHLLKNLPGSTSVSNIVPLHGQKYGTAMFCFNYGINQLIESLMGTVLFNLNINFKGSGLRKGLAHHSQ